MLREALGPRLSFMSIPPTSLGGAGPAQALGGSWSWMGWGQGSQRMWVRGLVAGQSLPGLCGPVAETTSLSVGLGPWAAPQPPPCAGMATASRLHITLASLDPWWKLTLICRSWFKT